MRWRTGQHFAATGPNAPQPAGNRFHVASTLDPLPSLFTVASGLILEVKKKGKRGEGAVTANLDKRPRPLPICEAPPPFSDEEDLPVRKRPAHLTVSINGHKARPVDVQKLAADARKERGQLTRRANGTAGRPRAARRQIAREEREMEAAELEARKVAQALRRQNRLEQRALRDDDRAARLGHQTMQQVLRLMSGGHLTSPCSIAVKVTACPSSPAVWNPTQSAYPGPRQSEWRRAEDGLRTVQVSASAVSTGGRKPKQTGRSGTKARDWRPGDAADNLLYNTRTTDGGVGENDVISNMATGQLQLVTSKADLDRVLACADAAEQVEAEAAAKGRRHTIFKKLIIPMPAELDADAHQRIMHKLAEHFHHRQVPVLFARHTPHSPDNPNFHLHGHLHDRRFKALGANEWAFAADRADVLSKSDLAEFREVIAEIFNEELADAGLAADFTHVSRLARGLAPSDERHRGHKKTIKQAEAEPGSVAEIQPLPPEPELKGDQAPESEPSSDQQNADPAAPQVAAVDETVPQADTVHQAEPPEPTRIMLPFEEGGRDVLPPVAEPSGLVSSPPSTDAQQTNDRPASVALDAIKIAGLELTSLGRAMAETVWQRTPWHRVSQAQQAEEDKRRAEDARREEERRRTEAERLAAEHTASRNAWWRTEMHEIIKRNHLLHMHDAADLSNPRIYDNADDRKFVHQTLQNPNLSEAERGAFLKAFDLAKQDYYEPSKRAQAQRDLAAYAKSDRQKDAAEAAISTRRAELNRSTGHSAARAGSDTATNVRGDGFVTRPGGHPNRKKGTEIGD